LIVKKITSIILMTNPLNYTITSPYGIARSYKINGVTYTDVHDGVDFALPQGTPVTLPPGGEWDGEVIVAQLDQYGGAWVDIKSSKDGGVARFLHLSRIDVIKGQKVTSNQQIGLSGGAKGTWGAGLSTGSHLHIGLLVNNRAVDPLPWLQKAYFQGQQEPPKPAVQDIKPVLSEPKPVQTMPTITQNPLDIELEKTRNLLNQANLDLELEKEKHQKDLLETISKLKYETQILPATKGTTFVEKLKSRKLWATIAGVVYAITANYKPELQTTLLQVLSLLGTYIGVEGINDILQSKKQ
jgi:hypothetical protein